MEKFKSNEIKYILMMLTSLWQIMERWCVCVYVKIKIEKQQITGQNAQ